MLHLLSARILFRGIHAVHTLLALRLLLGVAEVVGHREVDLATAPLVDLMAGERLARCECLPLACVEHVATVERHGKLAVHEVLAHSEVYIVVALAVALGDDLARTIASAELYRYVVGQDEACLHTRVSISLPNWI